ncbi:MAG: serine protease spb1 [Bdellovibrio sp.]|nr:serine protease spb1 [Bdellovibrio sp.]
MKTFAALLLIFLSLACARPNYISAEDLNPQKKPEETQNTAPEFPILKIRVSLKWSQPPTSQGAQDFILDFDGNVAEFETLAVLLWMPSMGHGSAPVKIERLSDYQYHVKNVYFIMPGDWEIRLLLKKDKKPIDQLYIPLMIP